jgi:membrane associated rhomboid family serine protease
MHFEWTNRGVAETGPAHPAGLEGVGRTGSSWTENHRWRAEVIGLGLLLILANLPLWFGRMPALWAFDEEAVGAGQWWRVFTYPLAHVSIYHLLLDGSAFLLGYVELRSWGAARRLCLLSAASAGSLAAAILCSPATAVHGLGGLSGVAHGLAALAGLQVASEGSGKAMRMAGSLCFLGVVGKGILEACRGEVLFAAWHLGWLGVPIAACHAGGILGALSFWLLFRPVVDAAPKVGGT